MLQAGRAQKHDDDAHGLLGVVAAVAEAVDRRREELQAAEEAVHATGRGPAEEPRDDDHVERAQEKAQNRRKHDAGHHQDPAGELEHDEARFDDGRARHAADQRVG